MGAYTGMTALLGDLVPIANSLHYPDSSICILKGDINLLKTEFPQIYSNLLSCNYHRDKRTPIEYGQDLVASWVYEDYLMDKLTECGLATVRDGADKNREILANIKVSSTSDCLITFENHVRKLEIMNDYKGYWPKYNRIDLRDDKYEKLEKENAIFLGVAPHEKKYIVIDFSKKVNAEYIPSHYPYGGKPAYQIKINRGSLKDMNFHNIVKDIKEMIL